VARTDEFRKIAPLDIN